MLASDRAGYAHLHITPDWRTLREYFARLEKQGMGINLATYVGATSVRRMVLGDADVQPTPAQLDQMKALVDQAMRDGAVGLSTALQYTPAPYAKTDELIALAREASKYGGIYATHMRSEGDTVLESIDEATRIGREAQIPVEIWHLKAAGKANWGKMPQIVARIEAARAAGVDVSANTYAYTAWFNTFSAFVPPWAHDGGDVKLVERLKDPAMRARIRKDMTSTGKDSAGEEWDNEWQEIPGPEAILIAVVQNPELVPLQGKRLSEVAALWHEDAIDALCDLLIKDKAFTNVAVFGMDEPDVKLALKQPWVSIDNDSQGTSPEGLLGSEHPHPRAYGTFPADSAEVCARGEGADAGRCDSQVFGAAGAADAADRSRRAEAGDVGRCGGLRSGEDYGQGDIRRAQSAIGGDGVRAGEWRAGDRGGEDDGGPAGEGAAGSGVHAVKKRRLGPRSILKSPVLTRSRAPYKTMSIFLGM